MSKAIPEYLASAKQQQAILAMSSAYFINLFGADHDKIVDIDYRHWLEKAHDHLVIRKRALLEKESQFRQLLPYVIVTQTGEDGVVKYAPFLRTPKAGEVGLHGKVSVGWGGHIDAEDVVLFEGTSVIEVANQTSLPVKIYAGMGIAQFLFFQGDVPCEVSYADRGGKYQGQSGITDAKV